MEPNKFDFKKLMAMLSQMNMEQLSGLQDAMFSAVTGSPIPKPHPLAGLLPKLESDPFEDIALTLFQIGELLRWVEGQLQREPPLPARLQFEDTHSRLLEQRQMLRRDWHLLLSKPYPASN